MNVRNCKKCGRLFNYAMGPIVCPQCKEGLEAKFKEVKKYIQEHPMCGIQEVSKECEIEVAQIQQWLREERLEFTENSAIVLNCESCGAPIRSGRYCDSCKNQLTNALRSVTQQRRQVETPAATQKRDADRMRFLK